MATRPWSFTASALSVLVVLSYLEWSVGSINLLYGGWAMGAIILFHAAGNTWSDYIDYRCGVDAADTHGTDTLTGGRFSPTEIRNLSWGLYAAAIVSGLGLTLCTGWPVLAIGLLGFLCALLYPPLKYRAWGDVVILLAYCLLPAMGVSYVAIGRVEPAVLWVALPVGLLVNAILHANNTRDMHTDRRAQVRTLAQLLGVRGSVALYLFGVLTPFLWVVALIPFGLLPAGAALLLLLLPMALHCGRTMTTYRSEADAAAIATLDQLTARLQLLFSVGLVLILLLS